MEGGAALSLPCVHSEQPTRVVLGRRYLVCRGRRRLVRVVFSRRSDAHCKQHTRVVFGCRYLVGRDGGYVRSCAGVDGRKVRCGCIRYGGCYLIVHSSSENSARS